MNGMKKIVVFLLLAGLFTACNNDKGKNVQATNREKDDYNDRSNSKNDSDKKTLNTDNADNKANSSTDNSAGWTKSNETAWMKVCGDSVKEKMSEERTNTYCSCMMEKLKVKYPAYAELNTSGTYEEGVEIGKKCLREMGLGQEKSSNNGNDDNSSGRDINSNDGDNTKTAAGWPQNEKNSFMINCEKKAMASGRSRVVAQSYCQCMMEKMESLYPDINDAGKLTPAQIERIIERYKDKCLE